MCILFVCVITIRCLMFPRAHACHLSYFIVLHVSVCIAQSLRRTEEQVLVNSSAIDNTAYLDCSALDSSEMKMKEETTYPNDYEPVSYETETEEETITKL